MSNQKKSKKIVIGLISEIAAGKTTVINYLTKKYHPANVRFSDMLTDILKRLHLEINRKNLQILSTILRQNFGEDLMSKVIMEDIERTNEPLIVADGIRRPSDITHFKILPHFYLIAITANPKIRYQRLIHRQEKVDDAVTSWKEFQKQSEHEAEQQIKKIAAQANFTINNNNTLQDLYQQIDIIINQIIKN